MFLEPLALGGLMLLAAILGVGAGYAAVRLVNRSRQQLDTTRYQEELRQAEAKAADVLETARRDADQIVRDAELRARDEVFKRREEVNRELETARNEVRDQERRAEKREDAADQKAKDLAKKERHLEVLQKKLAERKELLEKKGTR